MDSPLVLFTQGPWFPQEGCLNVMAQRHCLACRTFLVCLWRSAMQVLTCNTTAVQFVSRQEGKSSPLVHQEAVQLWCSHCPGFAPSQSQSTLGRSHQQAGLRQVACQKRSPAEHLLQVRSPRNRCLPQTRTPCVSVILAQTSLLTGLCLFSLAAFGDTYLVLLPITHWALRTPKQNVDVTAASVARRFLYVDLRKFPSGK